MYMYSCTCICTVLDALMVIHLISTQRPVALHTEGVTLLTRTLCTPQQSRLFCLHEIS